MVFPIFPNSIMEAKFDRFENILQYSPLLSYYADEDIYRTLDLTTTPSKYTSQANSYKWIRLPYLGNISSQIRLVYWRLWNIVLHCTSNHEKSSFQSQHSHQFEDETKIRYKPSKSISSSGIRFVNLTECSQTLRNENKKRVVLEAVEIKKYLRDTNTRLLWTKTFPHFRSLI